ncbi:hypothetical protein C7S18_21275 [Ahniella affigens]|uniref:Fibronectin type-III domain-containing protein n=2 Tax=Ahniella affigens TaxID=2021234 RepID=A0A2P1PXH5_9GAMM|nr:hypothetical protein C7S18_21275 [Ahniella affigens]
MAALAWLAPLAISNAAEFKTEQGFDSSGVPYDRGADYVSPQVVPTTKFVNVLTLPTLPEWKPGDPIKEVPRQFSDPQVLNPVPVNPVADKLDDLAQKQRDFDQTQFPTRALSTPAVNVEGQTNTGVSPSDVNGDIGPNHYVQAINGSGGALIRIYNKADGTAVGPAFELATLGSGGACATGLGDAVILYDELASRWVLTEFVDGANDLCFYISAGSNPASTTWTRYNFVMPSFPDYPHYGVWSDAYYAAANENGTSGQRPVYAFDRTKMLAGQAATFQRKTVARLGGFSFEAWQAADHDGIEAPPTNAPGLFMRHRDDESHNPGSNNPTQDFLEIVQLDVDFTTPANTVLTGPVQVPISEFSSNLNGLTAFNAFPQPNGQKLDPLREQVMNKLIYRNFGTHETLVGNMVTDVDAADTGGIRWFELRRTGGIANPWTLHQEGTYAPGDGGNPADRWMAGSAIDSAGNIAMGYSVTRQSPGIFPEIRYVGRLSSDTLGVMTSPERTLIAGGGSQSNERWGDYHSMSVDPVDGCTFWYTGGYMPTGAWSTRIGSFRFDECGTPTFTFGGTTTSSQLCANQGTPVSLPNNQLNVGSISGFVDPVNLAFSASLPTGFSGSLTPGTVTPPGTSQLALSATNAATPGDTSITVNATSGATTRQFTTNVLVATAAPGTPALTAPADNAIGQSLTPTFSWSAATQAASYQVQVATDAGFTTIVATQTVTGGTSLVLSTPLQSSTNYFWRVTPNNVCGAGTISAVRTFRTQTAAGDCDVGQTPVTVFSEGAEAGANGFVVSGTGASSWSISTARPFAGTSAWLAPDPATATNQLLDSPTINIPAGQNPVVLSFQSDETIEDKTTAPVGCWDGGWVEFSTNGGTNWTAFTATDILAGPFDGAVDGAGAGWCGDPRAYNRKVISLNSLAGQAVKFRFRFTSDTSVGRTPHGWYIDDISVRSCSSGPTDAVFANSFE